MLVKGAIGVLSYYRRGRYICEEIVGLLECRVVVQSLRCSIVVFVGWSKGG